ncbi:MAG: 30S ribosomal protein S20 [Acidimicrobiales bacterium]|nr:30S ribosomal protein S20 [Acidimicrobiales bacterium]
MANIASQKKRNRQNEKRRARNKAVRSELKTRIKHAETAAAKGDDNEDSEALMRLAIKRIDQAAAKGVLHRNAANRQKSRLTKRLARISADA